MMQMLQAGGLEIVTDNQRIADTDNPKGYYEDERVKALSKQNSWIHACHGKVVKIVSLLLFDLPKKNKYRIIFMQRPFSQVIASQNTMLKRLGKEKQIVDPALLESGYRKHLDSLTDWLKKRSNIDVLYVPHNKLLEQPRLYAQKCAEFTGKPLDINKMVKVVDPNLFRQRSL